MVVAALLGIGFVVARLAALEWDASRFVVAGEKYSDPRAVPDELNVTPGVPGYDGQAFYRLALEPFTHQKTDFGITLDAPSFRHQRILYPTAVWILSTIGLGSTATLLILVNLAGFVGIAVVGSSCAKALGRDPRWGLTFLIYPGFAVTLARDLSEIVMAFFLLLALRALFGSRFGWAAAAFTAAALARETSLVVPLGIGLHALWRVARKRGPAEMPHYVYAAPLVVAFSWQLFLWAWWGSHPSVAAGRQFSAPMYSGFRQAWLWLVHPSAETLAQLIEFAFLILLVVVVASVLKNDGVASYLRVPWFLAVALMAILPAETWASQTAFLRATTELYLLSVAILLRHAPGSNRMLAMSAATFWLGNAIFWTTLGP